MTNINLKHRKFIISITIENRIILHYIRLQINWKKKNKKKLVNLQDQGNNWKFWNVSEIVTGNCNLYR